VQPEALFKPDTSDIREHLITLFSRVQEEYPGGLIEMHRCRDEKWNNAYFDATLDGIGHAAQWAVDYNAAGENIYVGVNPRNPDTFPGGFAKDTDIDVSFFHFADLDSEESVAIARQGMPVINTMGVTTGTKPHKRVHLYWELENPTGNLKAWTDTQSGIANYFKGDRVIDPRRIMRLAGTINYPSGKKYEKGYRVEPVTIKTFTDERDPTTALHMHNTFAKVSPQPSSSAPSPISGQVAATPSGGLNLPGVGGGTNTKQVMEDIMAGKEWHNNVIRIVAHWIDRGWTDTEIMLACRSFTLPGYQHQDTDREVKTAIDGAREKWGVANPAQHSVGDPDDAPQSARTKLTAGSIENFNPRNLKPRDWLVKGRFIRGKMTMTVAPGAVGKSSLSIQEAIAIAAGLDFGGRETMIKGRVWIYNNEDDEQEILRRLTAACKEMDVDIEDVKTRIRINSGERRPFCIAKDMPDGTVEIQLDKEEMIEEIDRHSIDLVVLDPLIELHRVNENSNDAMAQVAGAFRSIAQRTNCAIHIVHHTRKPPSGDSQSMAGNADTARGAGAVVNSSRITETLYTMSKKDADQYGVDPKERYRYVRLDGAKANLTLVSSEAIWFERISTTIYYGLLGLKSEEIGTLRHVQLQEEDISDGQREADSELLRCAATHIHPDEDITIYTLARRLAWSNDKRFTAYRAGGEGKKEYATTTLRRKLETAVERGTNWATDTGTRKFKFTNSERKSVRVVSDA